MSGQIYSQLKNNVNSQWKYVISMSLLFSACFLSVLIIYVIGSEKTTLFKQNIKVYFLVGNLPTGCKLNGSSRHYRSLDIELQSLEAIMGLN